MPMRDKTNFGEPVNQESVKNENIKIMIFAEGQVTEIEYFEGIKAHKKELNIPAIIDVKPIKRPESKASWSNITSIIKFIEEKKEEYRIDGVDFLKPNDQLWIIFDRDKILEHQYNTALKYSVDNNYKIGFTNSCFELWLLLHFDGFSEYSHDMLTFSKENKEFIIGEVITKSQNGLYGRNKKNIKFKKFINGIDIAYNQSMALTNELDELFNRVGTTLHLLLGEIILRSK